MTILLLAGTAEARALAQIMADRGDDVVASLAGVVRQPLPLAVPTRTGGFGGEAGFIDYVTKAGITAVIDATHPFAARMTLRTARVCAALGLPYLRLERPGWVPGPGDRWTMIDREEDAAAHVGPGSVVFLATGRQTIDRYYGLSGSTLYCRQIDPAVSDFPFPSGSFVIGRPPFSQADEEALFRRLRVDVLVSKDAGGVESRTKLDAARVLGLSVLMIRRPPAPLGVTRVATVAQALDWSVGM